jgi:hypothetical protein
MRYALPAALMMIGSFAVASVASEAPAPTKRAAVVVGANMAAAGRRDLRFAHRDANQIAAVLRDAGRFAPSSVSVLRDPAPHEVLAALDKAIAELRGSPGESLLLFYYSGHSDDQALYPGGRALPIPDLLKRLDDTAITVRVGIIDACRGGAWTRAKGIKPVEPFEIPVPLDLRSEGSVLLASSTGQEDAHEAEALAGSFFTHHLVAGLRGAADRTRDGRITVGEVFEYAQAMTVRDTTLAAGSPQHPSFRMNLSGRDDLPMTEISESRSQLVVEQRRGPLQLIRLDTGIVVLELPEGEREARLAIPPGRYLVRRRDAQRTLGREISVTANEVARVDEANLELVGTPALAIKRFETPPPTLHSTLPAGRWEARLGLGMNHWTRPSSLSDLTTRNSDSLLGGVANLSWGISDRLQLSVLSPTLTYRFGELGSQELLLFTGLASWGFSSVEGFLLNPGAGAELRLWTSDRLAITARLAATAYGEILGRRDVVQASASAGYRHTLGDVVTLNLQLGFSRNVLVNGVLGRQEAAASTIAIGSFDEQGARAAPLLQFHLSDRWSLDGHASIGFNLGEPQLYERYLVGATFTW